MFSYRLGKSNELTHSIVEQQKPVRNRVVLGAISTVHIDCEKVPKMAKRIACNIVSVLPVPIEFWQFNNVNILNRIDIRRSTTLGAYNTMLRFT